MARSQYTAIELSVKKLQETETLTGREERERERADTIHTFVLDAASANIGRVATLVRRLAVDV
jgi:hypothetical protein